MGLFSKIVEWFKGPADDEEVIEIAARKAAEKAAAMAAREQAQVAPEQAPAEAPVEAPAVEQAAVEQPAVEQPAVEQPAAKKPAAKKAAAVKSAKPAGKKAEKKTADKKPAEKKPEAKPEEKPAPKKAVPAAPARESKASDRFPGVTTFRELSILEKNSCAGADRASKTVATLTKELKETVLQIARLRNPVDADDATRDRLSKERAVLRKQRDEMERTLTLARNSGVGLERTADNCQFMIRELTGQDVNHRKEARFNEVSVDITPEEVEQMRELLKMKN